MKKRLSFAAVILATSIGLLSMPSDRVSAGDACGVCFRTADIYWRTVAYMGASEIYEWLGTCLDINDCS